jgi:hypothetical protein
MTETTRHDPAHQSKIFMAFSDHQDFGALTGHHQWASSLRRQETIKLKILKRRQAVKDPRVLFHHNKFIHLRGGDYRD